MRLLRRNRWPVVIPLYDARQCPYCAVLVIGNRGQQGHEQWHEDLDTEISGDEPAPDPGGYVIPDIDNGALPEVTRGARWGEQEE